MYSSSMTLRPTSCTLANGHQTFQPQGAHSLSSWRRRPAGALASFDDVLTTTVATTATPATVSEQLQQQLPSITVPTDWDVDPDTARQGFTVLQQFGGQAAAAAGSAVAGLLSPFQLFDGAWLLDLLFFGVLGLLAYSLVVLAPRQ